MREFQEEARTFAARKLAETAHARQVVALRLICGIDLSEAVEATPQLRAAMIRRIERLIERERLKGLRRHWSYDLNRHIALKQALDRLREIAAGSAARPGLAPVPRPNRAAKPNGARRRRGLPIGEL